jgi:ABC-type branched-subunit amino acid transport system substrate-binding protein
MKRILLPLFLSLFLCSISQAQSLDSGIELYRNGDYERALRIFEQSESTEAHLFAAKSLYALGRYYKANAYLSAINAETNDTEVIAEAAFTKALVQFQLKNYAQVLDHLYYINTTYTQSRIYPRSATLYDEILNYLSEDDLKEVINQSVQLDVKVDALTASLGRIDYSSAKAVLAQLKEMSPPKTEVDLYQIESQLRDSVTYNSRYASAPKYPTAPKGMAYHLGVALPAFEMNEQEYEIAQHLYFGIQLAVEEFNSEESYKKAFLHYKNTNQDSISLDEQIADLIWNKNVDAIIGPLFSEKAKVFAETAQKYEVPVITPLANSDEINESNNYLFQLNPTFAARGKKMAQYAVNTLGFDTLAVLAELNSLGEASALAFRHEAERLGAVIQHFFLEDLESNGYDIFEYTAYLSKTDTLNPAPGLDAVYAPFTGSAAPTLIRNLLTDLEATRSDYTLLGSQEWEDTDVEGIRLENTSIHYSQGFEVKYEDSPTQNFESNFRVRFQTDPTRFAYIGYDVGKVVLDTIKRVQNPRNLKEGLRNLRNYMGLSTDVDFNGYQINQAVKIKSLVKSEF